MCTLFFVEMYQCIYEATLSDCLNARFWALYELQNFSTVGIPTKEALIKSQRQMKCFFVISAG